MLQNFEFLRNNNRISFVRAIKSGATERTKYVNDARYRLWMYVRRTNSHGFFPDQQQVTLSALNYEKLQCNKCGIDWSTE